jgi:ubiquitin-like protein ATG12
LTRDTRSSVAAGARAGAEESGKVKLLLAPVGNAPQLTKKQRQVNASDPFRIIYPALRTLLKLEHHAALFVFVNNAFSPGPDETFGDLFTCFGKQGHLIVNYALADAYG